MSDRDEMVQQLREIKTARAVLQSAPAIVRAARDAGLRPTEIASETGLSREGIWKMLKREA